MPFGLPYLDKFVSSFLAKGFLRTSNYLLVGRTDESSSAFSSSVNKLVGLSPGPTPHSPTQLGMLGLFLSFTPLSSPLYCVSGASLRGGDLGLRKIPIFLEVGWNSCLFWIVTPFCIRHIWVLTRLSKTSAASPTLNLTGTGVFLSHLSWITFRAMPNLSIFSLCSFRSWRMSFNLPYSERATHFLFLVGIFCLSISQFTSESCVKERVRIVRKGCTLGPQSYPCSLKHNLCLAGPEIHGRTGLVSDNTDSDACLQHALPDLGLEGASSWS